MCFCVCFHEKNKLHIVQFTDKNASLPIDVGSKQMQFIPWGRNIKEYGQLPLGGWLLQPLLKTGKWDNYFPKLVKIPVIKFMEQDIEGNAHWFDVISGSSIQGVILRNENETRLYIVTLSPEKPENPFLRWPVIIY